MPRSMKFVAGSRIARTKCDVEPVRPVRLALCVAMVALLAGCKSMEPPETMTETAASAATGIGESIVFRVEGGPVDEPTDPTALTLPEALRLAVLADPGIQAAIARVRVALADAKQARLLPNPVLNLAVRFPEGGGTTALEASLTQDLISILKIPKRANAADNRLRQASAGAVTVTIDLVAEVQKAYVSAQAIEQTIRVLAQRKEILTKALTLATARLAAGEGVREDVTVLRTQQLEVEIEVAEAGRQLTDERLRLARLIGRPSGAADWTIEPWAPPLATRSTEAEWIAAAMMARPELQEKVWLLAALGDDAAVAGMLLLDGASAGAQAQRDPDWQVGPEIALPIPVFDMGQARKERVTAEQIEARHELLQAKRKVIEDVRRAYQSLARSRANAVRIHEELIPLQEQRRAQANALFTAGQTDVTSLFLAEQGLRATQARAVEIDRQVAVAAIELQRAVGGPGPAGKLTGTAAVKAGPENPVATATK